MWKIAFSAVIAIFMGLYIAVVISKMGKKFDEVFGDNDDDTWPPGAVSA